MSIGPNMVRPLDLLAKNNTISVNNGGKFKYCELQCYLKIFAYVIVSSSISFHGDSSTADTLRWNFVIGIDTTQSYSLL